MLEKFLWNILMPRASLTQVTIPFCPDGVFRVKKDSKKVTREGNTLRIARGGRLHITSEDTNFLIRDDQDRHEAGIYERMPNGSYRYSSSVGQNTQRRLLKLGNSTIEYFRDDPSESSEAPHSA